MDAKQIFWRAIEEVPPEMWEAFLNRACDGDSALRTRVTQLLTAHQQANPLFDQQAHLTAAVTEQVSERPGATIGCYRLLEVIGEGGFGVIYLAEQREPFRRRVALKILKPGFDSRQVIARFEAERQALAMMDHPHIARVLEAGLAPSGRPFFAMELVHGLPITEFCDRFQLSLEERLQLMVSICQAVQHAHMKGIIHRDLKPSNVMVSRGEGSPMAKIIDFGIAKAVNHLQLTDKTLITGFAVFVGTPAYMSPEQASLNAEDVDTRSDVYSLGVLLYELLVGVPPFSGPELSEAGYDEMRRLIREVDPPAPSLRLATLRSTSSAERPAIPMDRLPRELDWIVMRALEKDRSRRYQSAAEMGADLQAFLQDEPIQAGPPSRSYRLRKQIKKHRLLLGSIATVVTALCCATALSLWQTQVAIEARALADQRLLNERDARATLAQREITLRRQLYASDIQTAWRAWQHGDTKRAQSLLAVYDEGSGHETHRDFTWHYIHARCAAQPRELSRHDEPLLCATLSPDGRYLASGDRGGTIRIWDRTANRETARWQYSSKEVTALAFSPDGRTLATAGQDSRIWLWNTGDWNAQGKLVNHRRTVMSISWSPDSKLLASGSRDESVRIWDVANRQEMTRWDNLPDVVRHVLWHPSQDSILAAVGGAVVLFDRQNYPLPQRLFDHEKGVLSLALSSDGHLLASGGYSNELVIFDLLSRQQWRKIDGKKNYWSMTFADDDRYLLTGSGTDGPVIWALEHENRSAHELRWAAEVKGDQRAILWDKEHGHVLIATEESRTICQWPLHELVGFVDHPLPEPCLTLQEPHDLLITADGHGHVAVRRLSTTAELHRWKADDSPIILAALSPDGQWLATHSADADVSLWFTATGKLAWHARGLVNLPPISRDFEFTPCGKYLALASADEKLVIWHADNGKVYQEFYTSEAGPTAFAFSRTGDLLATTNNRHETVIRRFPSLEPMVELPGVPTITDLAFTSDNQQLVFATVPTGAEIWDLQQARRRWHLIDHYGFMEYAAILPDDQVLATISTNKMLKLDHIRTGLELLTMELPIAEPRGIHATPSGRLIIAYGADAPSVAGRYGICVIEAQLTPAAQLTAPSP